MSKASRDDLQTPVMNIKRTNRVEPLFWELPNKNIFTEWITKTFAEYRLDGKKKKTSF